MSAQCTHCVWYRSEYIVERGNRALHRADRLLKSGGADRARAYVNGRLLSEQPLDDSGRAVWALTFPRDAFVTVEVEGDPTPVFDALLPGSIPLAFSNPIFVDADADGVWTPPGLLPFRDAGER